MPITIQFPSLRDRIQQSQDEEFVFPPRTPVVSSPTSSVVISADGTATGTIRFPWVESKVLVYDVQVARAATPTEILVYAEQVVSPVLISGLPTGDTYQVRLRARHASSGLASEWSPAFNVQIALDTSAPAVPTGVSVSQAPGKTIAHLTWFGSAETDLKYYLVYRSTSPGADTPWAQTFSTVFDDPMVTVGTTYYYRLRALDRSGNVSGFSAEVSVNIV